MLVAAPAMIHLQAALKTVNDTKTFVYEDCSDPGCSCCLQVSDCLGAVFVHSVLQRTPKVNICGVKSGECGAHSVSHQLMSRSSNRCLYSHNRVSLGV